MLLMLTALSLASAGTIKVNSVGEELHWNDAEVSFALNTSGSHGLSSAAIEDLAVLAANEWSTIEGSWLNISIDATTSADEPNQYDETQAIYFQDDWDQDERLLALTYVWSIEGGEILHVDMEINTEDHDWSASGAANANDLLNTLTHEFGHAVGLDHSSDNHASMASTTHVGEIIKRDVDTDDIDTYLLLYGNGTTPQENTSAGCSMSSSEEGSSQGTSSQIGPSAGAGGAWGSSSGNCSVVGGGAPMAALWGMLMAFARRRSNGTHP